MLIKVDCRRTNAIATKTSSNSSKRLITQKNTLQERMCRIESEYRDKEKKPLLIPTKNYIAKGNEMARKPICLLFYHKTD